jgi:hypothetical protein
MCHLQHKLISFYNRVEKCLLRGTDCVFKLSSLRFVFKGLINSEMETEMDKFKFPHFKHLVARQICLKLRKTKQQKYACPFK